MKKLTAFCLSLILLLYTSFPVFANQVPQEAILTASSYLLHNVTSPQVGSTGGEWTVLGLARSNTNIPEVYFQGYYQAVESYVKSCNGILHEKKYTEYSRVILALTAIGKDPTNVAGYNLLAPLGDYEKTVWQGMNGPVWALLALDSGNYEIPQNPTAAVQASRDKYIQCILDAQHEDGAWSLSFLADAVPDTDITAMAIQALAKYRHRNEVQSAIEQALSFLSAQQDADGGFINLNNKNLESAVQVLVALSELGLSYTDDRFIKNGNTLLDYILSYAQTDGGFSHIQGEITSNLMATEQAFYGLVSAYRTEQGLPSLYTMSDSLSVTEQTTGLIGKHEDVLLLPVQYPGKTFPDIIGHPNQNAVESLASRGIINGREENTFAPEDTMTRAEFATILVRGLGLKQTAASVFHDVLPEDWFAVYVNTASHYQLVNGTGENRFTPNGTLTREEAMVMIARAAALCGMDTTLDTYSAQMLLAGFFDYPTVSDWAITACAFCSSKNILDNTAMYLAPKRTITRAEVAELLNRMLKEAELL